MALIQFLLLGLSVASSTSAYAVNRPAHISLYEPSNGTEQSSHSGCGEFNESTNIPLLINTCLWGDYALSTNVKITRNPICANGAIPSLFIYSSRSCTGIPTWTVTSTESVEDACLESDALSTPGWSLIYRCEELESQAIASGRFVQAMPPNYEFHEKSIPKASDGVVTPSFSTECTLLQSKEPTILPADTCLTFDATGADSARSIFLNQPAICANGTAALFELFFEPGCPAHYDGGERDNHVRSDSAMLDKSCVSLKVRSMRFGCRDKETVLFEDLPQYEHETLETVGVSNSISDPPPARNTPEESQKPEGYSEAVIESSKDILIPPVREPHLIAETNQIADIAALDAEGELTRPTKTMTFEIRLETPVPGQKVFNPDNFRPFRPSKDTSVSYRPFKASQPDEEQEDIPTILNEDSPIDESYTPDLAIAPSKPQLPIPPSQPIPPTLPNTFSPPSSSNTSPAKIQPYHLPSCNSSSSPRGSNPLLKSPDTCIWSFQYSSLGILTPAICSNRTNAKLATYSRPGCHPSDLVDLRELTDAEYMEECTDIEEVNSFAFICEGLPESEIGNQGSVGGFFRVLGILLLILVVMAGLSILSCCLKGKAMMRQGQLLWERIMEAAGKREGGIRL